MITHILRDFMSDQFGRKFKMFNIFVTNSSKMITHNYCKEWFFYCQLIRQSVQFYHSIIRFFVYNDHLLLQPFSGLNKR